jgi:hypothetical protein
MRACFFEALIIIWYFSPFWASGEHIAFWTQRVARLFFKALMTPFWASGEHIDFWTQRVLADALTSQAPNDHMVFWASGEHIALWTQRMCAWWSFGGFHPIERAENTSPFEPSDGMPVLQGLEDSLMTYRLLNPATMPGSSRPWW